MVGLLVGLFVLGSSVSSAEAAPATGVAQGLVVTVGGWSGQPSLTLRNTSSVPCQITTSDLGSAQLVVVRQDGTDIAPLSTPASVAEGLEQSVATRLVTLAPGASRTIALTVLPDGLGTTYLESLAWSDSDSTASLYAVDPSKPLTLSATYTVPVIMAGAVPVCSSADRAAEAVTLDSTAPANGTGTAGANRAGSGWWLLALGAATAVGLTALVILVLRKRGRRGGGAAAVVILALGLLSVGTRSPDADAEIKPDAGAASQYAACMKIFRAPGGDPAGILPTLDDPSNHVRVKRDDQDENHELWVPDTSTSIVIWNTNKIYEYAGGGNSENCSSLYHELNHAFDDHTGGKDQRNCWTAGADGKLVDSGIKTTEVNATRAQNKYRVSHGLPARTTYGERPLPAGACQPPPPKAPPKPPPTKPTASSNGDPHLMTFDGQAYDFQAVGEFVAAVAPRGGLQVQVRQQPFTTSKDVSVTTSVAMDIAGDVVEIASGDAGMALLVNGAARPLSPGPLPKGGTIEILTGDRGPEALMAWPDGSLANVSQVGKVGLLLRLRPSPARAGGLQGLFGDFDGDPANDVRIRGGEVIAPSFATLYPVYADSWRITQAASLFTYPAGKTTASYTDRAFPDAPTSLTSIANLPRARAICIAAGITDATQLANCILDVGLTGRTEFARGYAGTVGAEATGSLTIDGAAVHVNLSDAEPAARYTFPGAAGQQIYVQVTASTVPNECSVLRLLNPSGTTIASGCLIGGAGQIDTITLPASGTYAIAVTPASGGSGTLTLKVLSTVTDTAALTLDGPAVAATIAQPGGTAVYTFSTTKPADVFVQLTGSTLPDQCGLVDLTDSAGINLNSGCAIGGVGQVDQTHLGSAGTYTITVDPDGPATGTVMVKLINDVNQAGAIAVNGPSVMAIIRQPGATSSFTFTATAGRKVSLEVSGSTFEDQCGFIELRQPDGREISSACSISGTGSIEAMTLPVTGQYTLVVDADEAGTGSVRLRLVG